MSSALILAILSDVVIASALIGTYLAMRRQVRRQTHAADVIVALNAMLQAEIDELQQRSQDMEMLTEMSELLQLSTSIAEACEVVPAFGTRLFPGFAGAVNVTSSIPKMVETKTWWGGYPAATDFATSDCWALRRAQTHLGTAAGIRCPHAEGSVGATLCVPMLAIGEAMGVVTLNLPDSPSMQPHVEQFAKSFADQIAFAFANLRLQETLHTRAVRDVLTGLFNRRFMEESLSAELLRAARTQQHVGVMIIDVDHFKRFNDTYGHAGGDALLQQLARRMQTVMRDQDVVCRYGGEEFVVLLPDADAQLLRDRADLLIEAARNLHVQLEGEELGTITVSAGIALSHDNSTNAAALLALADRALYGAKAAGRDRVVGPFPQIVAA